MPPIPRLKDYKGPALLSNGFRPFFLFGSIYAGGAILVWLAAYAGEVAIPTAFAPLDWHMHEMLYGFVLAVITGFLLTAVPNWTGRLPLQSRPLLALALLWVAGRVLVAVSGRTGWALAAIVDCSFPFAVTIVMGREIVKGKNWRNLPPLGLLLILFAGDAAFHLEAHFRGAAAYGARLGLAATIMLIVIIGGRVVPSFTRNWLVRENPGRLPAPAGRFDAAAVILAAAALAAWAAFPEHVATGVLLLLAGLVQAARLARWAGDRTFRDRLVFVLHVAYAFVPLGFLLGGAAALGFVPASAGVHAWAVGAIGMMTLAIMSRASLGHTGRALVASPRLQIVYGLIAIAAVTRVAAALTPDRSMSLLMIAGLAWTAAFLGFAGAYWSILTRPRVKP